MAPLYDIAVVGYGPTGLTAASLLGRLGHRVVVCERWPGLYGLPRLTDAGPDLLPHRDHARPAQSVTVHGPDPAAPRTLRRPPVLQPATTAPAQPVHRRDTPQSRQSPHCRTTAAPTVSSAAAAGAGRPDAAPAAPAPPRRRPPFPAPPGPQRQPPPRGTAKPVFRYFAVVTPRASLPGHLAHGDLRTDLGGDDHAVVRVALDECRGQRGAVGGLGQFLLESEEVLAGGGDG